MPSFDVISKINYQEFDNALANCLREIGNRFDFKGLNISIELEITTKDGEKIPMIAGYTVEILGGNLVYSFQAIRDKSVLFNNLSEEAEKDEKMRKYGEFLNITCSFNSHSVQYH